MDLHHLDANPDSIYHLDADPDSIYHLDADPDVDPDSIFM
jgi:hypothetical protein